MKPDHININDWFTYDTLFIVVIPLILMILGTFSMIYIAYRLDRYINLEKNKFSFDFSIPQEFSLAIRQYLIFFVEYVRVAKEIKIDADILGTKKGLRIVIFSEEKINSKELRNWLQEYLSYIKLEFDNSFNEQIINMKGSNIREADLLKIRLKNEIEHLKKSLELSSIKINDLVRDKNFLMEIISKGITSNQIINKQIIKGGNQQFANSIITK